VAIANERIAHQSGGLMYLRIEDTDLKRKVDGAVEAVKSALRYCDIRFDEGAEIEGAENAYGPYYQRERAELYINGIIGIVCDEGFICPAALLRGFCYGIGQGTAENTGTDQREGNAV